MKSRPLQFLALLLLYNGFLHVKARPISAWHMQPIPIQSPWASRVSATHPLPEYPRPQMVRSQWQNLNGLWDYAITAWDADAPTYYQGKILVPFPIESALSGVQHALMPKQRLWYHTTFATNSKQRTLLHFGAVDWKATVYLNGHNLGSHRGGYNHFSYDITTFLKPGKNDLIVSVYDPTSQGNNPHGKQSLYPRKILYTACSGIWQTVWLETVPDSYIAGSTLTPDLDANQLQIKVSISDSTKTHTIQAISNNLIAEGNPNDSITLHIPSPHPWSPQDPYLYPLTIRLLKNGIITDSITSYFAMRKISLENDNNGRPRIFLNHKYIFNLGVLDQGYWPDGIYTAPTDSALAYDINVIKQMGFNTIRKHIKIEPDRWYYHCDKLGMLVWQDLIPPAGYTQADATIFEDESPKLIQQLYNFPSIIVWTLFNEGWGAYDQLRLATQLKRYDPGRLLDAHSGANMDEYSEGYPSQMWAGSDFVDVHKYPGPAIGPALPQKAAVLGEWGGIGVNIEGHRWDPSQSYSYLDVTRAEFPDYYQALMQLLYLYERAGLSGAIYTQPFDVEREENGLITYDRKVPKIPVPMIRAINDSLLNAIAH
ncbi:sugar-binding domain-containing protein [Chitinophaga sp.]|uniref:glycoside hydrolase family 2 protein n=1 Tax=Chitinophaga sp. TaxID=1869181 RepID=UPI0031D9243F